MPTHFPIEEVARYPLPGMAVPSSFRFSPDGRLAAYLFSPEGTLTNHLFVYNLDSGEHTLLLAPGGGGASEANLSRAEKLRRERARQLNVGVVDYAWIPDSRAILIPLPDGLYVLEAPDGALRLLADSRGGPLLDPQPSPDGRWVSFVQNQELWIIPTAGGKAMQITHGAVENGLSHGLAEYIAQEEMGRSRGYWWSPDSQHLAFCEVDERHIPAYRIIHQGKASTGPDACEDHHYPYAGQANALVRLGVTDLKGTAPVWMDLGDNPDIYLARAGWFPDGSLAIQVENREQTELSLLRGDPASGRTQVLLQETSPVWINLHNLFRPLKSAAHQGKFIWGSERSGFMHLYLYAADGRLLHPLTAGAWLVDSLEDVDEQAGRVYFSASRQHPTERHLYAVPLAGGDIQQLTQAAGFHTAFVSTKSGVFIDLHTSLAHPARISLNTLASGAVQSVLHTGEDARIQAFQLEPPEMVDLTNRSGDRLFGLVYRPPAQYGAGPYPTIVQVYGGPHAQLVTNSWGATVYLRAQHLRQLGYLVFILDNRGSARRGLAFEGALRRRMGSVEVEDQQDGVRWLVEQGLADPERVGVYGWSYGGYMTLMCLLRAGETFRVGVSGAPVTDWDGYDTHYTERYMGTPQNNPAGYQDSSALTQVDRLQGQLMLVHGLVDENVQFRHTARLINALIKARKKYALLLFPDERHSPRSHADRVYMEEHIRDFFLNNL